MISTVACDFDALGWQCLRRLVGFWDTSLCCSLLTLLGHMPNLVTVHGSCSCNLCVLCAGADTRGRAAEGSTCRRLRAQGHQAWQHHVAAPQEPLDAVRLGCATNTGSQCPVGFSLAYAAPEVLRSYASSAQNIQVTEAMDAWSVGILALELFSGNRVFDATVPKETVHCCVPDRFSVSSCDYNQTCRGMGQMSMLCSRNIACVEGSWMGAHANVQDSTVSQSMKAMPRE